MRWSVAASIVVVATACGGSATSPALPATATPTPAVAPGASPTGSSPVTKPATSAPTTTIQGSILTPTATLGPEPPPATPVTVWPSPSLVEPSTAAPEEEVRVEGSGGITELRSADGKVTGYWEGARSFDLYFDGESAGSIGCYFNLCQGSLNVPAGVSPGSHKISVEGGSSIQLSITQTGGSR